MKPSNTNWKYILGIYGLLILLVTIFYSGYLAKNLKKSEDKNREIYILATKWLVENEDLESDARTEYEIQQRFALPSIIVQDGYYMGSNWGSEEKDTSQAFLANKVENAVKNGIEPMDYPLVGGEIYFFYSPLATWIRYYPLVQMCLVIIFVLLGYYVINLARNAEQNRVWAGMAKETAHQLGTPISAIIAWIEYLKETNKDKPEELDVLNELRKDVNRLELVADRFSKIGSSPELEKANVYELLDDIRSYMQRRAPRKVVFDFPEKGLSEDVKINKHLFSWVLENLIRNSLDAMDGKGTISATVYEEGDWLSVDLTDTGKGIPSSKFKSIFEPGVTTKQRGWGLGLSLAKRIIENYHEGKIFVKQSKPNEATTFTIRLPKLS